MPRLRKWIVSGTDVYVAGRAGNSTSTGQATYWKNGTSVNLASSSSEISFAKSIAVAGSDVYVAVFQSNGFPDPSALIIKNGVVTDLSGGFVASAANAVFLQGSDVYVAGRHGFYQATYWKNNVVTNLPYSEANCETGAFGIYVSGTDVYVSGFEKTSLTFGNIEVAKYWRMGLQPILQMQYFMQVQRPLQFLVSTFMLQVMKKMQQEMVLQNTGKMVQPLI